MPYNPRHTMLVVLVMSIAVTSSVLACSLEPEYFTTVYLDAFGQRITGDSNQNGSRNLNDQTVNSKTLSIAAHNNLCVSLVMTNQFKSAKRSCERALHFGAMDSQRCDANGQCPDKSAMLAIVYSNFGVVLARLGETSKAELNFSEALRLDPQQDLATHNLGTLGSLFSAIDVVAMK